MSESINNSSGVNRENRLRAAKNKASRAVRTHVPHIVATASVATAVGVVVYYHNKTYIDLTPELVAQLKRGGRFIYPAHGVSIALTIASTS